MASIISEPAGRKRIQFFNGDGQRKSVRLGKATMKQAEAIKLRIEHLVLGQVDPETTRWLESCSDRLHAKIAKTGLVKPRESTLLGPWLDRYIQSRKGDLKDGCITNLELTRTKLLAFFKQDTPLRAITANEASEWRQWLLSGDPVAGRKRLSEASARHHCGNAKGFFSEACRRGLIFRSPFEHLSSGSTPAKNDRYVTPEEADRIIENCPDMRFKLLFALARYAGLRTPSETHILTWSDVDWINRKLNVRSPKTEHHEGHERRWVPIMPKLMQLLEKSYDPSPESPDRIVTLRPCGYQNRTMIAYIKRAEVQPWKRLWQTLRSSCEKEWAMKFPQFAVSKWIGHSITVSGKHYANHVPEELMKEAAADPLPLGATGFEPRSKANQEGESVVQPAVQHTAESTETDSEQKRKSPELPGFSGTLPSVQVGATGFEPATPRPPVWCASQAALRPVKNHMLPHPSALDNLRKNRIL